MIKPVPGARVVPRPVASNPSDAASEDFWRRCRSADHDQAAENARAERRGGQPPPAAPTAARPTAPPQQPLAAIGSAQGRAPASAGRQVMTFDQEMEAGAAHTKALVTGQPTPAGTSPRPTSADNHAAEERGAGAARDVIAIAGQPGTYPRHAPEAGTGTEAAAGAAEARRLLGLE